MSYCTLPEIQEQVKGKRIGTRIWRYSLLSGDKDIRLELSEWILRMTEEERNLFVEILFSNNNVWWIVKGYNF